MTRSLTPTLLLLALVGCAPRPAAVDAPSEAPERLRCDRLAARAIQAADPAEARGLASEAATCYAGLPPAR
jgi:hypothetical protein